MIRVRALPLAFAAVGLLSLVALASQRPLLRAHTHGEARASSSWGPALLLLLALGGLAVLVYGLRPAGPNRRPGYQAAAFRLIGVLTIVIVVGLLLHQRHNEHAVTPPAPAPSSSAGLAAATPVRTPARARPTARSGRSNQPAATTWWEIGGLVVVVGLALIAARFTRRQDAAEEDDDPDALVALLDDSLEDLRRDPDARRAVIATYARMERGLGAHGLVRHPADTPMEYLNNVLAAQGASELPVSRLTDLFEQAKFSKHHIDEDIRRDAVTALEAVKAKLRADQIAADRIAADQIAADQIAGQPAGQLAGEGTP